MSTRAEAPSEWEGTIVLHFRKRGEKGLAYQSVIFLAVLTPRRLREQAQGTFPEESRSDFTNIMGGGETDCTCWCQTITSGRKQLPNSFGDGTNDKTVIPHGERGPSSKRICFSPAIGEFEGGICHIFFNRCYQSECSDGKCRRKKTKCAIEGVHCCLSPSPNGVKSGSPYVAACLGSGKSG